MTTGAPWTLKQRLVSLLTPETKEDAELRIELLRAVARSYASGKFFMLIAAAVTVVTDLNWVAFKDLYPWFLAVALGSIAPNIVFRRLMRNTPRPEDAGLWTLRCVAASLPFQIIWPAMVVFAWVPGDGANNAFMVAFLTAGLAVAATLSSASLFLALPTILAFMPYLAIYTIEGHGSWAWSITASQLGFGFLMMFLSRNLHRVAAEGIRQKLKRKALVEELAAANKTLELARRQAEDANRSKSDFIAAMSHDLRTPLNAVIGFSDLIRQGIYGPLAPARYAGYIDDIHNSGRHLLGLINDILDLAKIEAGKRDFEEADVDLGMLAEQVRHMMAPIADKAGVRISCDIPPRLLMRTDERALMQVLANLLSNAVKFTKAGGSAMVFVRRMAQGGIVIGVADTGVGIKHTDMPKILSPYGQVKSETTVEGRGTGLGLPIVRGLVEALGGRFAIESTPGVGTQVRAEFPPEYVLEARAIA